jgi:hypothetical protein
MIITNLSKPSQVLTARYLPITVSNTIKVSYDHTRIVCREIVGLTAWSGYWYRQGWISSSAGGRAESWVTPFFLGCAGQSLLLFSRKISYLDTKTFRYCATHRIFCYFELCSICLRKGLGRSKHATSPWNKHKQHTLWRFLLYPSLTEPSSID